MKIALSICAWTFKLTASHDHLTVACLIERDSQFLLVEELIEGKSCFNQPAGHVDPGEHPKDAALRETLEETGYRVELTGFLGISVLSTASAGTYYRLSFIAQVVDRVADAQLDEGIVRAVWRSAAQIRQMDNLRSPLVLHDMERYLAGQRFPLSLLADTIRSP